VTIGSEWRDWFGGVEWIHLAQDRGSVVGCCKYGDEPVGSGAME
jgi:hypothetical protein